MIKYALGCHKEHEFEGWFASSEEFARLKAAGHLDCPECGSTKIEKLLMAPSVKSTKSKAVQHPSNTAVPKDADTKGGNVPAAVAPAMPELPAEVKEQFIKQLREMKKHIIANADNVGKHFGEEARKIHYGEAKERAIYGSTSAEEAVELLEEGISLLPMPVLPEDKN